MHATRLVRRPRVRAALLAAVVTHPEQLDPAMIVEMLSGGGKPGFVPALDALTSYPIRHRLHEIACPTLVVWGERDRIVPVRDAGLFGELISDSRVVIYRDTGHVSMIERPVAFNALLAEAV
jgi:pimeloyl-ACP methyl ester carboxylesterase